MNKGNPIFKLTLVLITILRRRLPHLRFRMVKQPGNENQSPMGKTQF